MSHHTGKETGAFQLFTEHYDNADGLGHLVDGDTLIKPIDYISFPAEGAVSTVIQVFRGPEKYAGYDPITVGFRSLCEFSRFYHDSNLGEDDWAMATVDLEVEYVEPCPTVEFAGALSDDQTFSHNLKDSEEAAMEGRKGDSILVVARNPQFAEGRWKQRGRLERVTLEWRAAGSRDWRAAINASPIDSQTVALRQLYIFMRARKITNLRNRRAEINCRWPILIYGHTGQQPGH